MHLSRFFSQLFGDRSFCSIWYLYTKKKIIINKILSRISVCICKNHCINVCGTSKSDVGQPQAVENLENLAPDSRLLKASSFPSLADGCFSQLLSGTGKWRRPLTSIPRHTTRKGCPQMPRLERWFGSFELRYRASVQLMLDCPSTRNRSSNRGRLLFGLELPTLIQSHSHWGVPIHQGLTAWKKSLHPFPP